MNCECKENIEVKGKISVKGNPLTLLGRSIAVGDKAPDFTAVSNDMKPVKLSDFKGKTVVLSVFPSIDTPVCAVQTRTFNKKATELDKNVVILTLSKDLPFALGKFCAAEGINNVHTLSDYRESEFGHKYGFLIAETLLLARGVVIIDKEGMVKYVEYVKDIATEPNYEAAIKVLRELK